MWDAYDRRCAVIGFDAVETLQAAHIDPYRGAATNKVSNGILLRATKTSCLTAALLGVGDQPQVLVKQDLQVTRHADNRTL